jgi:hypothetical protein
MRVLFIYMMDESVVATDTVYGDMDQNESYQNTCFQLIVNWNCNSFIENVIGTLITVNPLRYMVYSLLAKCILSLKSNGTGRYNDCVIACDSIMNAAGGTQYQLEPRSSYFVYLPSMALLLRVYLQYLLILPSGGWCFMAGKDLNRNLGIDIVIQVQQLVTM